MTQEITPPDSSPPPDAPATAGGPDCNDSVVTPAPTSGPAESAPSSPVNPTPPASPELPSIVPPTVPPAPTHYPIVFHGRVGEYFRIWIVNTLLTLLTLGVFFAWAKVRKRRYLRGSTELMGHRFDYRANPVRLLIGHIVVLVLFLGYSVFGAVYPTVRIGVLVVALALLPWIVVRSFTFNAHNTVYRGLRFRFNRSLSAAVKVYLLEPLLIGLTLGFYYPAWQRSKRAYAISNHRYGDAYFAFNGRSSQFYGAYLSAAAIVVGAMFIGGMILYATLRVTGTQRPGLLHLVPFLVVYGFGFYLSRALVYAMLFNHVWNHTTVDEHRFAAKMGVGHWVGLQLTNLGASIVSAGLMYPWAVIRAQRYAASCLSFEPARPIDDIQSLAGVGGSATGDMAAEFIGIDFGL